MDKRSHTRLALLWTVPALIAALVLGIFSVVEFTAERPRITLLYLARDYEQKNYRAKAADAYYSLVMYGYKAERFARKAIEYNYTEGNMQQVLEVVNQAYKTQAEQDKKIAAMYEDAQKYVKTQSAMGEAVKNVSDEKTLEEALNELNVMHEDDAYDDALLYYYEYYLTSRHGLDIKAVRRYIEAGVKANPEYTWMLPYYAQCLRMQKELDAAEAVAKQAVEHDAGDFESWHQLSIIYLLKGNTQEAVKAGETSYGLLPYLENCNDLALAYVVAGQEEKYQEIAEFMKSKGETVSSKIQYYRDGKTTLSELFYMEEAGE